MMNKSIKEWSSWYNASETSQRRVEKKINEDAFFTAIFDRRMTFIEFQLNFLFHQSGDFVNYVKDWDYVINGNLTGKRYLRVKNDDINLVHPFLMILITMIEL